MSCIRVVIPIALTLWRVRRSPDFKGPFIHCVRCICLLVPSFHFITNLTESSTVRKLKLQSRGEEMSVEKRDQKTVRCVSHRHWKPWHSYATVVHTRVPQRSKNENQKKQFGSAYSKRILLKWSWKRTKVTIRNNPFWMKLVGASF